MSTTDHQFHHFDIRLDATGDGFVKMDGEVLRGVRDVKIDSPLNGPTIVTVSMIGSVEASVDAAELEKRT